MRVYKGISLWNARDEYLMENSICSLFALSVYLILCLGPLLYVMILLKLLSTEEFGSARCPNFYRLRTTCMYT